MELENRELEVLDEGSENTVEVGTCCSSGMARLN